MEELNPNAFLFMKTNLIKGKIRMHFSISKLKSRIMHFIIQRQDSEDFIIQKWEDLVIKSLSNQIGMAFYCKIVCFINA